MALKKPEPRLTFEDVLASTWAGGVCVSDRGREVRAGLAVLDVVHGRAPETDVARIGDLVSAAVTHGGAWFTRLEGDPARMCDVVVASVDVVNAPEEAERLTRLRGERAWYDVATRTEHRLPEAEVCEP